METGKVEVGPPLLAKHVKETGWYWLDRRGPPRGYVYISTDPDEEKLYLNSINGPTVELKPEFHGVFYKVPDDPIEYDYV